MNSDFGFVYRNNDKILQRGLNPKTLELLKTKGCNMQKCQLIYNVFYVDDRTIVPKITRYLEKTGFNVIANRVTRTINEPFNWHCEVQLSILPSLNIINNMTDECINIANDMGANYDGWYTEI